jgi:putative hydrolase of the HAD superfamily
MKYEAVIFDLFGTLVDMCPWTESNNILKQMAQELSAPPDDFINLWHATFNERMKGTFNSYQANIKHICQQLGVHVQNNQIELAASIRFDMTKREVTTPREGALEVLSYLKSNSCKTGLISNCSFETTLIWEETPLAPLIDFAAFSCLIGAMKPDPHIYHLALEKLVVKPKQCLYIADGIGQELASASKLGMHAIMICTTDDRADDPYREAWNGPVISSLEEVLTLVK